MHTDAFGSLANSTFLHTPYPSDCDHGEPDVLSGD